MIGAGMSLVAHDDDNLACAGMERIADPNLTRRTPGSMTLLRPAWRIASGDRHCPRLIRSGLRGRFYNVVDLVNQLETETRAGRQGRIADYLTRLDFVILDELGYLPFAQAGRQLLFHLRTTNYSQLQALTT
ncbi:IstB-like ATP binding protein [Rhizobiales bacterium GAS191]|nr:IstB-like ATP binding protein [Rhizobiales bacterium GAS113]SEE70280.1 IstB-like ATP binding protein [Rhizobiales bacterium GAS191]